MILKMTLSYLPNYLKTLEKKIRLMKRGYKNRSPLYKEYIIELNRLGLEMKSQPFSDEPITKEQNGVEYAEGGSKIISIFGLAGTGKSTVVRIVLKHFPRAILPSKRPDRWCGRNNPIHYRTR